MRIPLLILSFFWQLPQNILAIILIIIFRRHYLRRNRRGLVDVIIYKRTLPIEGVSLGNFILLNEAMFELDGKVCDHEYGHTKQSLILGPVYLIAIALFSYINHRRSHMDENFKKIYYTKFPEKWADRLGGVKR